MNYDSAIPDPQQYNKYSDNPQNSPGDEIRIPFTYESDRKAAINSFLERERVKTETGEITLQGEIEVERGRVKI